MQRTDSTPFPEEEVPVRVSGGGLLARFAGAEHRLPLVRLPSRYLEWILKGRRSMYDRILKVGAAGSFFYSHLPVLTTYTHGSPFPFNSSNKGVGFLPREEYLQGYIERFRETRERTRGKPWAESLRERLKTVGEFYFNPSHLDDRVLTSLEIFEKQTFRNLQKRPLASLHYTGGAPDYISFQVNCAVEIIGPGDRRYDFIRLARTMFEYDAFHIAQAGFPYAYLFWISEVKDKTPYRVPPNDGKVIPLEQRGSRRWTPEAMAAVNRAPGMIRQFITQRIETYAQERGFDTVTLEVVQEAKEVMERKAAPRAKKPRQAEFRPYGKIYVALDTSPPSDEAMRLAVDIGKITGAGMVGSHVYAAKLHDARFRAMEGGLPSKYQQEKELGRQRQVHDTLITRGLELITDSYLQGMEALCRKKSLRFTGVSLEGKNWERLVGDIADHDYDLVAMGAHGIGRVARSQMGSVAERVLRRVDRDVLLCRRTAQENCGDSIVVCLDGSARSWGALQRGLWFARAFDKKLIAVSAFDPYFHYTMFKSLNRSLTQKAREVFKFEEQEKLHEDIIDSGLAKIYRSHLDIAGGLAAREKVPLETHLLEGKPFETILGFAERTNPWLLILGRTGYHSGEDMDLGGVTENVARACKGNLLIVAGGMEPPVADRARATVTWTKEAEAKLTGIPEGVRGMAVQAIQNHCIEEGHTLVTLSVLDAAIRSLLPAGAIERMGLNLQEAPDTQAVRTLCLTYRCRACGHVHRGSRPALCTICGAEAGRFEIVHSQRVMEGRSVETIGGRRLIWDPAALHLLEEAGEETLSTQLRNRIEKRALARGLESVTLEMAREAMREMGETGKAAQHFSEPPTPSPSQRLPSGFPEPPASDGAGASAKTADGSVSKDAGNGMKWEADATRSLQRVPKGFIREMTKKAAEQWARDHGAQSVSGEAVRTIFGQWAKGSSREGPRRLRWTEEASRRAEKIPAFVRPVVVREIENKAIADGLEVVDGRAIDRAMRTWKDSGSFHHHH